jgi:protein-S-isoprenylcysteine O-methyltransferase Ste14
MDRASFRQTIKQTYKPTDRSLSIDRILPLYKAIVMPTRPDPISLCAAVLCLWAAYDKVNTFILGQAPPLLLGIGLFYVILGCLFLTRQPVKQAENRLQSWIFALGGTLLPLLLQPTASLCPWVGMGTIGLFSQTIGLLFMLLALVQLGDGFGVLPALRSLKTQGLYNRIRHPLYAAEILFIGGVVCQAISLLNVGILLVFIGLQLYRAMLEEQLLLAADNTTYQQYLMTVRYRFFPGVL